MSAQDSEKKEPRPLLIVISDSATTPAEVRSRQRDVWRWCAECGPDEPCTFTGDPGDPGTYEWSVGAPAVTALIALDPVTRARNALAALRAVRPDAAVLLLSDQADDLDGPVDGTLARPGRLRDVLRVDVEEELERLEAERRVHCLREFVRGDDVVPILIHGDPDPDAVSSALAVATLLGGSPERTPIVTFSEITRPENRRMVELLHIRVTCTTLDELRHFDRVITVDTQPRGLQQDGSPRLAVIDHHPQEHDYVAEFADVRPRYGATATMLTEYLRASDEDAVRQTLATALLFGIKTDTDSLTRGATPADVEAYAFLQGRADQQLIRRFERPAYREQTARAFGRGLAGADSGNGVCVACVGELDPDETHVLADLADFCLGIEHITWAVVAAVINDEVLLTLRHAGAAGTGGAGAVARAIARHGGSGGGHATMARVTLPRDVMDSLVKKLDGDGADFGAAVRELVLKAIEDPEDDGDAGAEAPVSRPGSRRAHRASARG